MKDLARTENNDLVGFTLTDSEYYIVEDIIDMVPGENKEFPILGANLKSQLNGCFTPLFFQNARIQLELIGLKVERIWSEGSKLKVKLK